VCLCGSAQVMAAEDVQTNYPPTTTTGGQVLQLPQDENKLYLTLYGNPDDERYQNLRKWFNENNELKAIRAQVHYAAIDTDSKLFKERYADEIDMTPCIRVVTPSGLEVLRIDGNKIPMSDLSLNKGMRTELLKNLFGGRPQKDKKHNGDRMNPKDKFKNKIDEKIDDKIDNANLPPVASYVMSKIVKRVIHTGIAIVIVVAIGLGVFGAIKQAREIG